MAAANGHVGLLQRLIEKGAVRFSFCATSVATATCFFFLYQFDPHRLLQNNYILADCQFGK